jgi:hypothetical protein
MHRSNDPAGDEMPPLNQGKRITDGVFRRILLAIPMLLILLVIFLATNGCDGLFVLWRGSRGSCVVSGVYEPVQYAAWGLFLLLMLILAGQATGYLRPIAWVALVIGGLCVSLVGVGCSRDATLGGPIGCGLSGPLMTPIQELVHLTSWFGIGIVILLWVIGLVRSPSSEPVHGWRR